MRMSCVTNTLLISVFVVNYKDLLLKIHLSILYNLVVFEDRLRIRAVNIEMSKMSNIY